jgi:hypothetical protein
MTGWNRRRMRDGKSVERRINGLSLKRIARSWQVAKRRIRALRERAKK